MKRVSIPLVLSALFLIVVPQVLAIDITITDDGRIEFYQTQVLGEESDDDEVEVEEDEQEDQQEEQNASQRRPDITRSSSPTRPQEIRMKANNEKVEIRLQNVEPTESTSPKLRPVEMMESDRVRLRMSAEGRSGSPAATIRAENRAEVKTELEALRTEYKEKLQAERQERKQEMVEIRNQFKERRQQLLLESRNVRAELKNGAQFTIDPNTNEIMVTTPSGNTHILNHLPDQAIERMKAAGVITDSTELEIDNTDESSIQYKLQTNKPKKFLGLFKREVPVEVKLDDNTGEVSEESVERTSRLQQLLDRLSY